MFVLKLVPALALFLFLGGQVLLLPGQAQAWPWCCYCGQCMWWCTCPGDSDMCPFCRTGGPDTFQANSLTGTSTFDIRGVREPLPFTVTKPEVSERLMQVTRGAKRVRGNFTIKLLDSVEHGLKFACPGSDEKNIQENTFAFRMKADTEK